MKINWQAIGVWALAIGLVTGLAMAGGCRVDELVKVKVPAEVRDVTGAPEVVTLRDAPIVREDYILKFQRGLDRMDENIADAEFWRGMAEMALNSGMELAVPYLGTIPGGAILTLLMGGVAGKLMKRPGEDKRVQEASDAAWEEAVRETLRTISTAKEPTNGNPPA